jgi:hypothetical protein
MSDDLVKRLRSPEVFLMTSGMISPVAEAAADRIEKLEVLLDLYRDAVTVDATMQGPIFRGANSSALKRAWYHDRKALEGKDD